MRKKRSLFRRTESGNVFFTLFGAVAIVGVLGAGIMATMRGPLTTMVDVNRREQAKAEARVAASLVLAASTGDTCADSDGFTEGVAPDTAGTFKPTNGGVLPATVSAAKNDPWGNAYGYCSWDHGLASDATTYDGCDGGAVLAGNTDTNNLAIAIISAGPNGVFNTTCENDNAGTNDYVEPDEGGGDDIVVTMTYNQAIAGSGGLWNIKSGDPNAAEINKNIDLTATSADLGGLSPQLKLGASSLLLPTRTGAAGTPVLDTCNGANIYLMRVDDTQTPPTLDICDGTNFRSVAAGASLWQDLTGGRIHYGTTSANQVGIGTNNPNDTLDVNGTFDVSGTSNLTGNVTMGGTLGVTGATTLSSTLSVGSTLSVTGTSSLDSDVTITGSTSDHTADALTVNNGGASTIFTVQNDGKVGINGADPTEALDVNGHIMASDTYMLDGSVILSDGNNTATGTVLVGQNAGGAPNVVTGNNNTLLGANTGGTLTTGTDNILIGQGVDTPLAATSNYLSIGDVITGNLTSGDIDISNNLNVGNDLDVANDAVVQNDLSVTGDTTTATLDVTDNGASAVTIAGRTNTDELYVNWNGTSGDNFIPSTCAAGSFNRWDGNSWECEGDTAGGSGGGGAAQLEDLTDVDLTSPAEGDCLYYNNADSEWQNVPCSDLPGLSTTQIIDVAEAPEVTGDTYIDVDTASDGTANSIVFVNNDVESMRIDASGNIGVGMTPTGAFDLLMGVNEQIRVYNSDGLRASLGLNNGGIHGQLSLFRSIGWEDIRLAANNGGWISEPMTLGDRSAPHGSAQIEVRSTGRGFLPPRMTEAQRDAINGGVFATGLLVFNTEAGDNGLLQFYDGTDWIDVGGGGAEGGGLWTDLGGDRIHYGTTGSEQVGIGTNNPLATLDVNGGVRVGSVAGAAPSYMVLNSLANVDTTPADGECLAYNSVSTNWESGPCGGAGTIADDALDFDKFVDAMNLDASTSITADGTEVLSITNTGTGSSLIVNDEAGDTTPFVITADGKVGIRGSATPSDALTVGVEETPVVNTNRENTISMFGDGAAYFRGRDTTNDIEFIMGTSTTGEVFAGSMTNHDLTIRTNNTRRMFFTTDGRVGVNLVNIGALNTNAAFQIDSTSRGFLPPRNADPGANITGVAGLMAYDTTDNTLQFYNGTAWQTVLAGTGGAIAIDDLTDGVKNTTQNNFFLGHEGGGSIGVNNLQNTGVGIGALDALDSSLSASTLGDNNTALGYNALTTNTSGGYNTAIGNEAMRLNVTGGSNTAIGHGALERSITFRNTAVGTNALNASNGAAAENNIAVGANAAMYLRNASADNVFMGTYAGEGPADYDYTGSNNVIIGHAAARLMDNTNNQNTIIGADTAATLTGGGSGNILLGYGVDVSSTTSSNELNIGGTIFGNLTNDQVGIGVTNATTINANAALQVDSATRGFLPPRNADPAGNITGTAGLIAYDSTDNQLQFYNGTAWVTLSTASGVIALNDITDVLHDTTTDFDGQADDDDDNLFIGHLAASLTGTADPNKGARNTAIGATALDAVTEGDGNVAIGYDAGSALTTGFGNVFIGSSSGRLITTNSSIVAIGATAGRNIGGFSTVMGYNAAQFSTGSSNTYIGYKSGDKAGAASGSTALGVNTLAFVTGNYNVALGGGAATGVDGSSTAANSVFIGRNAGTAITTGNNNIFMGFQAGDVVTDGGSNIIIGYDIDPSGASASNELNIGGTIFGNLSTDQVGVGVTNATTINANAALQVDSATRGFLPPRNADPASNITGTAGLIAYDSTDNQLQYYNGSTWISLAASGSLADRIQDVGNNTHIDVDTTDDGATDSIVFTTNNATAMTIDSFGNIIVGANGGFLSTDANNSLEISAGGSSSQSVGTRIEGSTIRSALGGNVAYSAIANQSILATNGQNITGDMIGFENNLLFQAISASFSRIYGIKNSMDVGTFLSGSIPNAYGYYGDNPTITAGTGPTNLYGIYLEDMTAGVTNNYAIYSAGGISYFADPIGIGTATPNANAALDVNGTNLGFLPPRNADPASNITGTAGLIAYDSTDNQLQYYNGSTWVSLTAAAASDRIQDVGNNTSIDVDTVGDGSADSIVFTNNTAETMRIAANGYIGINNPTPTVRLDIHETGGTNGGLSISNADSTKNIFIDLFTSRPDITKELGSDASTKGWAFTAFGNSFSSSTFRNDLALYYVNGTTVTNWIMFDTSGSMVIRDSGGAVIQPNSKAILDLTSSTRGFLPPRNANPVGNITSPPAGLMAYDSGDNELQYYNGSTWVSLTAGGSVALNDLTDVFHDTTTDFDNDASNNDDNLFIGHLGASLTGTADPNKGARNTAIGATALDAVTQGDNNVAIGYDTLTALTTGENNVAIGRSAGDSITSGGQNTLIGFNSGGGITTQGSITAVGRNSGLNIGANSVVMGYNAGQFATGANNVYIGQHSGNAAGAATTNAALGHFSLADVTGSNNAALGANAGQGATGSTAARSVFIGKSAGTAITTGNNNIFMGYQAGDVVTDGGSNIIIGYDIDPSGASASNELNIGGTIFGNLTNDQVGIGVSNATAINANAALQVDSATRGFLPPRNADPASNITGTAGLIAYDSTDNQLQYYNGTSWVSLTAGATPAGANTQVQFNNSGALGASSNFTWNGTTLAITGDITFSGIVRDVSDQRLKTDITPLNPDDVMTRLTQIDTYTFRMKDSPNGAVEYGVMAQELEEVFPELVHTADDEMKTKSVNYMGLIAPMIEATKTLKSENESLKAQIEEIKTAQADLMNDVQGLKEHTRYGIQKAAYDNWLVLVMMAMMGGIMVLLIRRKQV